jgi:hypothetical protein
MADPNWDTAESTVVPARPDHGYWTKIFDYVDAPRRLKFEVPETNAQGLQNQWSYAPQKTCFADGDYKAPVNPANCLFADAPPGALIGKIGGSKAGKSDGSKLFVVGSFCVLDLDDKTKGPLYLTMNADPMSSLERSGELSIMIYRSV